MDGRKDERVDRPCSALSKDASHFCPFFLFVFIFLTPAPVQSSFVFENPDQNLFLFFPVLSLLFSLFSIAFGQPLLRFQPSRSTVTLQLFSEQ